jgi:hypothetical protein
METKFQHTFKLNLSQTLRKEKHFVLLFHVIVQLLLYLVLCFFFPFFLSSFFLMFCMKVRESLGSKISYTQVNTHIIFFFFKIYAFDEHIIWKWWWEWGIQGTFMLYRSRWWRYHHHAYACMLLSFVCDCGLYVY